MFRVWSITILVAFSSISQIVCDEDKTPLFKYRYETEDMMKTSASSIPVRGYHVVEGNYYPAESGVIGNVVPIGHVGLGAGGLGAVGPVGFGHLGGAGYGIGAPIGIGGVGYQPQFIGAGLGSGIGAIGLGGGGYVAPIVHGYGGEDVEKSEFSGGKKNLADTQYKKAHGQSEEQLKKGEEGYSKGSESLKDVKGEEGYYSNKAGGKNVVEDGKQYNGGQAFNQEGKNGAENTIKKGHKKGHKIKGFKSSHHKDETGKTEEFYDEEHDEGDKYEYQGQNGAFGQKGESSYKGGHEDGKFKEEEHKKAGHVNNEHAVQKHSGEQGQFGQNKFADSGSAYGVNNGFDQQSLLGHQENARFIKHHPVPFYHHI